ncbi:MAG: indole acetimide hydrolase [Ilumatobacteraceae bacterium]|nr:indole acetimide hydrolase [Ilumatobacteraceae bacterium]
MSELWQRPALTLAADIASGQVSSREVLEAHLERVAAVNGDLNAIVRLLPDEACDAADEADAAVARGDQLAPLHGVPCTVKENIDLAGTPTTQGVAALAEAVATQDAPTVTRMRSAGAIPFARTNLPDFGLRVHTDSSLHGLTRNPWNPNVTAGGSSGGEGSAIASGMSPIGIGNDIGGSLRNPAHCCGIASLKPTVGVIPMATEIPPQDQGLSSQLMVVEGPMARTVADVRAGLDALAGQHWRDPRSVSAVLADNAPGERIRIAVLAPPEGFAVEPGIAAAIHSAADRLADSGHDVIEATPPDIGLVVEQWLSLLGADITSQREILDMVMGPDAKALLDTAQDAAPAPSYPEVTTMHVERYRLLREWAQFFQEHPVLLSPTWARPAFEHGADVDPETGFETMLTTIWPVLPANLLGMPAAITPAGVTNGLPVGAQVMGDRFNDLRCLTIAAEIEAGLDPITPIDPVTT